MRVSEALALYPKDVDPAVGSIAVLHGKGDRHRVVGIDRGTLAVVRTWLARRPLIDLGPTHHLFCTLAGRQMNSAYLRELLPRLAREAGITDGGSVATTGRIVSGKFESP